MSNVLKLNWINEIRCSGTYIHTLAIVVGMEVEAVVVAEFVDVVESEAKVVTRADEEVEELDGACESYVVVKELLG
jgi:hypothetical protein